MPFGPWKRRKKKKKEAFRCQWLSHASLAPTPARQRPRIRTRGPRRQHDARAYTRERWAAEIPQDAQIDPRPGAHIWNYVYEKPKKKKEILNLEVAKLDKVNNSQSALFSRKNVKKAGRRCETGGIAGLAKRGGARMSADRDGGLEEKKKGRYGQCFGDSRLAAMCEPRTHKQFRKAVLYARCRRHERSLGNARWVFCHFTTVWHRRVYFTGTYGNGNFGKAL